ncbi:MAG: nucleotidyltransferase family protein [Chloroflexi bacterium]|nr:nucleotidyltransferase family protein [Chloroflexota bacterium]
MKALVLAAGEGTRLRPLTLDRPKPMVPIGGRPLLEYAVRLLKAHGVEQIAVNLHYQPEAICSYLGDGGHWGVQITYSLEHPILGTAGAARRLDGFLDETFLVFYGDVLTDLDLTALVRFHRMRGVVGTLALHRLEDPTGKGVVDLDADGLVRRFVEKPAPGESVGALVSAGVYVLEPAILGLIPPETFFDFGRDLFPMLVERGYRLAGWLHEGYLVDVGSVESYAQAEVDFQAGRIRFPFDWRSP